MKNDEVTCSSFDSFFSPRQRRVIAAGLTTLAAACVVACIIFAGWILLAFLSLVSGVVTPLVVAWILSLILKPYYGWLYRHLGGRHLVALGALLLSIILPFLFVVGVFGSLMVAQLLALIDAIPQLYHQVMAWFRAESPGFQTFLAKFGLAEQIEQMSQMDYLLKAIQEALANSHMGAKAITYGANALQHLLSLLSWLIVPVYLVYFLIAAHALSPDVVVHHLAFLKKETRGDLVFLLDEFVRIIAAYFRGQLVIAGIQGVLFGIGFWAVGLPYGLVLGLSLGCLNVIPYLGNIIGLSVALPLAFFGADGGVTRLLLVIGVFVMVRVFDGYWLTPRIQSKGTGLSDIAIVFSLLFWGVIFQGILGILLAIPLSAFFVVVWRLLKRKYIREVV